MFVNALILLATFLQVGVHAAADATKHAAGPVVGLNYATFEGTTTDGVDKFLGMPYAQPPIGDLRFRRPQPPLPIPGNTLVRDFTFFRALLRRLLHRSERIPVILSFVGHKLWIRLPATELHPALHPGSQLHRSDHVRFESQRV